MPAIERIKFCDLSRQQKNILPELKKNINNVLSHCQFVNGPEVRELEKKLSRFAEVKYAAAVSSGTDALLLSLMASGINPGDLVITPVFTFIATAEVVSLVGARPVFVDINSRDYNIDVNRVEDALQKPGFRRKVKTIIAVDLFGQCADCEKLKAVARKYKLVLIEDAAQAFGAEYKGKKAGSLTDIGCVSFFPSKPLGCYGEGGMIFTNNKKYADKVKALRSHGEKGRYNHIFIGTNSRLDTLQAAVLLAKLSRFKQELKLRRKVAGVYLRKLQPLEDKGVIALPKIQPYNQSAWAQFSIRVLNNKRHKLTGYLAKKGIPTAVHYPKPLHLQPAFKYLGYKKGSFPAAEKTSREILSLPFHPYLKEKEIEYICSEIKKGLTFNLNTYKEGKNA